MAFETGENKIATTIGPVVLTIEDGINREGVPFQAARFGIKVYDQNGEHMETKSGNLIPHLTTPQKNGALQLLTDIRTKAEAEIIGA